VSVTTGIVCKSFKHLQFMFPAVFFFSQIISRAAARSIMRVASRRKPREHSSRLGSKQTGSPDERHVEPIYSNQAFFEEGGGGVEELRMSVLPGSERSVDVIADVYQEEVAEASIRDEQLAPEASNRDEHLAPEASIRDEHLSPPEASNRDEHLASSEASIRDEHLAPPESSICDEQLALPEASIRDEHLAPPESSICDEQLALPEVVGGSEENVSDQTV